MSHSYQFPRAALAVDCVVFGFDDQRLKILLIQRDVPPFQGNWALPGGFVHVDETVEAAARRELREETGLSRIFLEQLYTFGDVDRDPRERVVTVAWYALVRLNAHRILDSTNARDAAWFSLDEVPRLAFDHKKILQVAHQRLRGKVRYEPIGFELLPPKFTLTQLQQLYEAVLDRSLDKRNFRKKILKLDVLKELDELESNVAHRAARLYRFDRKKYHDKCKQGINFEI